MVYNSKTIRRGIYKPVNPKKYAGDVNNIVYRSNLEKRFFKVLDENPDIVMCGSEEFSIPYISPLDGKKHRYFIDLIAKTKEYPGKPSKTFIIEIKPFAYTQEPKAGKKSKKTLLTEMINWSVNSAKWNAAQQWAKEKNVVFKIFTEKDLLSVKKK